MKTSEQIDQLAIALAGAQAEFGTAPKDAINPHFKTKFANLTSIWDSCRASLGKHGLCIIQSPSVTPERFLRLTTRLLHKSGQWIESELDLKPSKDDPQGMGSAITYARRYSISAVLGIVSEEDDDGHAASIPSMPMKPKPLAENQHYRVSQPSPPPSQYDMNNPQCKSWLWARAKQIKPEITSDECAMLNTKLNGLSMDDAANAITSILKIVNDLNADF